jgi:aminoglycoside phosphotransferase family enzyme/predicted kinase
MTMLETVMTLSLPDALLDASAFPHRPERVELRETHISWVFLAGSKVYKVKKPVHYPFVDYSTPALRRAACRAEVELNRRFAPGLYRGVVALVRTPEGGLTVRPEYDPGAVDYAVVMGRYDEAQTLDARLARGAAQDADLEAVGAAVAQLHAHAPVEDHDGLPGVIEETLATLAATGAPPARLAALARFCRAALTAFGPELAQRARSGLVRDGHGDLRAEHILLTPAIHAVDGVEFDRALRVADVGYDLAFLVMDVARRDDELSQALVRGYRQAGGDPGGPALLDFFCVVRALVRAKVDLLRAAQLTGGASQERCARAWGLLELAERFAWRVRLPRLVCVTGLAASGKSTLAEALAAASGRRVLSSDRIRKLRAGVDPYQYAGAAAYGDSESRAVYAELAQRAVLIVRNGGAVIVDATFRRPADTDAFVTAARGTSLAGWIVCEAPAELRLERAAARAAQDSISDAGPLVVARENALHHAPLQLPAPPLARLDTSQPLPLVLGDLARQLDARLGGGR